MKYKTVLLSFFASTSLVGAATTITEDFTTDPSANGWQIFGDASLFHWNSTNHTMEATWDSSKPNSYFHHSLGATLSKSDDFTVAFDLRMLDITPGPNPAKPYT